MILFSAFLLSTIITILLMPIFISLACKVELMDFPNDRKIHCDPIPKIGGFALALGAFAAIILWAPMSRFTISVLIGSGVLVFFGIIDDFKNLGFKVKFTVQIIAALIVIIYGGLKIQSLGELIPGDYVFPHWISIPLTTIAIVAVTNAINLSDGLDGLAGGMTLLSFLFIGYLSYLLQIQALEVMSAAIVGAIFGLLRYNTHPAKVFMGDAGSQFLGFVAITLSLQATRITPNISPILPLFVIGFPIIDTLSVMFHRILEGKSPFKADKNHLHHKIIDLGLYHSESVVLIYIIHAVLVCYAFIFKYKSDRFLLISFIMFTAGIILFIFLAEDKGWRIKRYAIFDIMIKGRLRKFREENVIIKVSFKVVEIGFISLLIFSCLLPRHIHVYLSYAAILFLGVIFITWLLNKNWTFYLVETSIFLMIPFLAYLSETDVLYLNHTILKSAYTYSFGVLVVFVLLTLKFTRRSGFKTTPLDFLILFIALVVPNLPDERIRHWQMGFIATKIVVLFFTYEILRGEMRLSTKKLGFACVAALMILGIRGITG